MTFPTSGLALIEHMAADNNSVRYFLTAPATGLKWGSQYKISMAELHAQYWQFMIATGGSSRVNITKFTKVMKELSGAFPFEIEIQGKNEVYYLGIGV